MASNWQQSQSFLYEVAAFVQIARKKRAVSPIRTVNLRKWPIQKLKANNNEQKPVQSVDTEEVLCFVASPFVNLLDCG